MGAKGSKPGEGPSGPESEAVNIEVRASLRVSSDPACNRQELAAMGKNYALGYEGPVTKLKWITIILVALLDGLEKGVEKRQWEGIINRTIRFQSSSFPQPGLHKMSFGSSAYGKTNWNITIELKATLVPGECLEGLVGPQWVNLLNFYQVKHCVVNKKIIFL